MSGNEAQDPPGYDYNGDGVVTWEETLLTTLEWIGYGVDIATNPSGEGLAFGQLIRIGGKSFLIKEGPKLLSQFNNVKSLIQGAGKLTKVKAGMQGFVKGDGYSIFKAITNSGTLQSNGQYLMQNGMQIGSHLSKSTGAFTIHITPTVGKMIKIRITP